MQWPEVLTIVGTNLLLIFGMLGTFIGLYLNLDKKLSENRKETNEILEAIKNDQKEFQKAWLQESKDFHGRLCSIEERGKQ